MHCVHPTKILGEPHAAVPPMGKSNTPILLTYETGYSIVALEYLGILL